MRFCSNWRTTFKVKDLVAMRCDTLTSLVKKFNKKITVSESVQGHKKSTFIFDKIKNEINTINVDIANAIGKTHDNWLDANNLDNIFAK